MYKNEEESEIVPFEIEATWFEVRSLDVNLLLLKVGDICAIFLRMSS